MLRNCNRLTTAHKTLRRLLTRKMITNIEDISNPPTEKELENLHTRWPSSLPEKFRRDIHARIFVNRSVNLENIRYFGCKYIFSYALIIDQMIWITRSRVFVLKI